MASPAASIGGSIIQAQKSKYPAKYITLDDSGDKSKRNPDGTMNYLPETKHGIALDYSIFGNSAEGVDLNDITEKIVAHSGKSASLGSMSKGITTPRKTNFKRARRMSPKRVTASNTGIGSKASASEVATPKKALPFNFMPDGALSSSRKGSSSLLNKPLGSSTSKPIASGSGSVAINVAASGPLPATGWGNMFGSKVVGEWKCDGCLIVNTPDAEACISCNLLKGEKGSKPGEGKPPEESKEKSSGPPAGFGSSNAGAWDSSGTGTSTSTSASSSSTSTLLSSSSNSGSSLSSSSSSSLSLSGIKHLDFYGPLATIHELITTLYTHSYGHGHEHEHGYNYGNNRHEHNSILSTLESIDICINCLDDDNNNDGMYGAGVGVGVDAHCKLEQLQRMVLNMSSLQRRTIRLVGYACIRSFMRA
mmetsp:Transcript_7433/g.10987  ORF Transcript_7433/g.10987 Transcript_7433/m.10987 type:complete len:421 (+) Transcript_7433:334-1596(+)